MRKYLYGMILFILIVSVVSILVKHVFTNIETFIGFKDDQTAFANRQGSHYENLDKEIMVNPGILYDQINEAGRNASVLVNTTEKPELSKRFAIDPYNKFTDADREFCARAKSPAYLPKRPAKATIACGWWFVNDPYRASVGVLGKRDGPIFTDRLPAGGEWIWDIGLATKKEDIKRCKKVKNCKLMNIKSIQSDCGFCPNLGHAIPKDKSGKEKYPKDAYCGTQLILNPDACPGPKPKPIKTPEGVSCGTYGRPSDDNRIRLYTSDECKNIDPMSSFIPNGECLKPMGGSYSWDCRELNGPNFKMPTICDPDDKGRLSRACLLSLCQGMGYSKGGAIVKMLSNPVEKLSEMDSLAIQILGTIGISVPKALLGEGDIDADSAMEHYYNISDTTNGNVAEVYREAAKWLVYGTENFDPCAVPDDTMGPFLPQCIQREFRKAGCQPAGEDYPGKAEMLGKFSGYKWSWVKKEFADLYASMKVDSVNYDDYDKAVKKCLGVNIKNDPVLLERDCADRRYKQEQERLRLIREAEEKARREREEREAKERARRKRTESAFRDKLSGVFRNSQGWETTFTMAEAQDRINTEGHRHHVDMVVNGVAYPNRQGYTIIAVFNHNSLRGTEYHMNYGIVFKQVKFTLYDDVLQYAEGSPYKRIA